MGGKSRGLVVIDDFDLMSGTVLPDKTNAPFLIDTDAVLTLAISAEPLEVISRRQAQVLEGSCCVQILQLARREPRKTDRESGSEASSKQQLSRLAAEAPDHLLEP